MKTKEQIYDEYIGNGQFGIDFEKKHILEAMEAYASQQPSFIRCLKEEFLFNTQNYPQEYHKIFEEKFNRAISVYNSKCGKTGLDSISQQPSWPTDGVIEKEANSRFTTTSAPCWAFQSGAKWLRSTYHPKPVDWEKLRESYLKRFISDPTLTVGAISVFDWFKQNIH